MTRSAQVRSLFLQGIYCPSIASLIVSHMDTAEIVLGLFKSQFTKVVMHHSSNLTNHCYLSFSEASHGFDIPGARPYA